MVVQAEKSKDDLSQQAAIILWGPRLSALVANIQKTWMTDPIAREVICFYMQM